MMYSVPNEVFEVVADEEAVALTCLECDEVIFDEPKPTVDLASLVIVASEHECEDLE